MGERESVGRKKNNECMKGKKVSDEHQEKRQKVRVQEEKEKKSK